MTAPRVVRAPFMPEQVRSLDGYQASGAFHEFTCGSASCPVIHAVLTAQEDGWRCPACGYAQDWAHAFMTGWSWKAPGSGAPGGRLPA